MARRTKPTKPPHPVPTPDPTPTPVPDPVPPPPIPAGVLPYYLRLVVPADRLVGDVVVAPAGQYTLTIAQQYLQSMGDRFNAWLYPRAGFRVNFDCSIIKSKYTLLQMQSLAGLDGNGVPVPLSDGRVLADELGEGCSLNFVWEAVAAEDPILKPLIFGLARYSIVLVGGGGVAGGLHAIGATGKSMVGDVEFSSVITGQLDPWSVAHGSGDAFKLGRSWSHEVLHSLGVYCHAGDCFDRPDHNIPGTYQCIDTRFTSFPLNTGPAGEQIDLETKLYDGQKAQMQFFSGPWVG